MSSTGHVFVSHSSDNRELANELAAFLEARGVRIWIAPRDVRPGMDYSEQLQLAIENAAAFVVLVTEMANKSPYVRAETEMAFSTHKPLFPVRISDIQPAAGLALFLKIRHWTDAYGPSRSANLDRLAAELQALTGANAPAQAPPPQPAPPAAQGASTPPATSPALAGAGAAAVGSGAAPAAAELPATSEDEEKWRAAVGPNADLYLERWREMARKNSSVSWNWAACFANFFWFAYRKMWLPAAGMAIVYLVNVALAPNKEVAGVVALAGLGLTMVCGFFGTHLYRKQTARLIVQAASPDREAELATLRRRGGVSQPALWGAIGYTVLLVLVAGALVAQQQSSLAPAPADPFSTGTTTDPFNTPTEAPAIEPDKPVESEEPPPEPEIYDQGY